MGLYDTIHLEQEIEVVRDGFDRMQSKTIKHRPTLEVYKIEDDRLYEQQFEMEETEEEMSFADSTLNKRTKNVIGFEDMDYHGQIEMHTTDREKEEYLSYKLKFTDGELVDSWELDVRDVNITTYDDLLSDED